MRICQMRLPRYPVSDYVAHPDIHASLVFRKEHRPVSLKLINCVRAVACGSSTNISAENVDQMMGMCSVWIAMLLGYNGYQS